MLIFSYMSKGMAAQNVGIGTNIPTNKLSVAGKVNITDSLGVGTASPRARLDVLGNTLLRGTNSNTFNTPLLAGVEFFTGRSSLGVKDVNQTTADLAFNWSGAGGGFRHFIETRHDIVPGNGNALGFYINNQGTAAGSSTPAIGNTLQLAITGSGVGVGTNTPDASAQIEIKTANKGLLLPRVVDTTAVAAPAEGLMIYNRNTKRTNFFDGARWQSLQNAATTVGTQPDSITYTIGSSINNFVAGTFQLISSGHAASTIIGPFGGGTPSVSVASFSDIIFKKATDNNSAGFIRNLTTGAITNTFIEIKFFKPGSTSPYYSVKGTNFFVNGFDVNTATGFAETISIVPTIIGFKNWINNTTWAWNRSTNVSSTY